MIQSNIKNNIEQFRQGNRPIAPLSNNQLPFALYRLPRRLPAALVRFSHYFNSLCNWCNVFTMKHQYNAYSTYQYRFFCTNKTQQSTRALVADVGSSRRPVATPTARRACSKDTRPVAPSRRPGPLSQCRSSNPKFPNHIQQSYIFFLNFCPPYHHLYIWYRSRYDQLL